ncbi:MAG: hypothetical protein A2Y75_05320 [Candidatus Solincola sediminis]|uniref:Uncharacterized protein n=1 Tax=Candidatus Solincola sediminis TaxID=1797199 RepID=A0A1F2WG47_9ACTN|nr:MAG: hypothetical protein A2Y75_05320 [Candidatus Solincola sediminis]
MGYTHGVSTKVREYLETRSDRAVYLHRMAQDLGFEERQIQAAIATMIYKKTAPIIVIQRGRVWRWLARENGVETTIRTHYPVETAVANTVDAIANATKDAVASTTPIVEFDGEVPVVERPARSTRPARPIQQYKLPTVADWAETNTRLAKRPTFISFEVLVERPDGEIIGRRVSETESDVYRITRV